MTVTVGIDVGTSAIKTVVVRNGTVGPTALVKRSDRLRHRDVAEVVDAGYRDALLEAGIRPDEIDYVATTGEGDLVAFRTGHFYGMTSHGRGAVVMVPEARAVLDVGALHARAIVIDERGRVLRYRMTSQCASGSGQFLENISRYLGVALEEIGSLSLESTNPEKCSSICAVLAETDVINMVSRGIRTADILKGIHLSMASRFVKLLEATEARGTVAITGGLSADRGLFQALSEEAERSKAKIRFATCPDAVHAGAIGAAVLGDYRLGKLKALGAAPLRRGASTGS